MTDLPCVGCPFRRDCPGCPWSGEIPAVTTESDTRTGVKCETMGGRKTAPAGNRGLTTETSEESKWL